MGLCSALSLPPTLPLVIKLLLFVCSLFWCKSSFGAFQLVFVKDAGAASKGDLNGQALISLEKK